MTLTRLVRLSLICPKKYVHDLRRRVIKHVQNISTVLMNVHPRAESPGPSVSTTGMTAVSILVSNEATQSKFEVQILSGRVVSTR